MNTKKRKVNWLKIVLRIILLPIILVWIIWQKIKRKKTNQLGIIDIYNLSQIDSLSGIEFEQLLKTIFEKQGYKVMLTKKSHDYGADLILNKNNKLSIVQAKCYGKNIGIKAVQEIIAARAHYKAEDMFVATNRYFSKEAIILAGEHNVKLIDRDVLVKLVQKYSPGIEPETKKFVATNSQEIAEIEARYKFWI